MSTPASVLFVCVHNSGKSQIAAAIARHEFPHVLVTSAGTAPSKALHPGSLQTLAEVGIDVSDEPPKALTPALVEAADLIVVLGTEAKVNPHDATAVQTWPIVEPSEQGIEGAERMRLVRQDITARVRALLVT